MNTRRDNTMNVRERFEDEVCDECEAYDNCPRTIEKQSQCAALSTYFRVKKLLQIIN